MLLGSIHPPLLGDDNAAEVNSRRAMQQITQNRQIFYPTGDRIWIQLWYGIRLN